MPIAVKRVTVKRVYERPARSDGYRVLVDRLWPRGISKDRAALHSWLRDLAPSDELWNWFHARPENWLTFRKRYLKELALPQAAESLEELYRLAQENLLARTPYRGYAVASVTAEDIRNFCEVRLILETAAAGLAAERATQEELRRLAQKVNLRYAPGHRETYSAYLKANSIFHRELARASHNVRLESMVMAVLDELQRPLYLGLDIGLDADSATQEHVVLVEAVKDRDPARARRLQAEQITRAGERMIAALGSKTAQAPRAKSGG